jgi:hypothetical protein
VPGITGIGKVSAWLPAPIFETVTSPPSAASAAPPTASSTPLKLLLATLPLRADILDIAGNVFYLPSGGKLCGLTIAVTICVLAL